jgi:PPM family protein phosphatase
MNSATPLRSSSISSATWLEAIGYRGKRSSGYEPSKLKTTIGSRSRGGGEQKTRNQGNMEIAMPSHSQAVQGPLRIVDAYAITNVGAVRQNNEDAVITDPARGIFVLADGMGGHPAGEVASSIAVAETHRFLATHSGDPGSRLAHGFTQADNAVLAHGARDPQDTGLATTLVAALVHGPTVWVAHAGDSRAYLFHHNALRRLTTDHGRGNTVHRAIGGLLGDGPDITPVPVVPGDILLLCSDGLNRPLNSIIIGQVVRGNRTMGAKEICNALVRATFMSGAPDNVTVAIAVFG